MPPIALPDSLPLPRGWPRRVRSAVVQVISLARTSLALTQGWPSESMNRQLRRRAEGVDYRARSSSCEKRFALGGCAGQHAESRRDSAPPLSACPMAAPPPVHVLLFEAYGWLGHQPVGLAEMHLAQELPLREAEDA